MLELDFDEEKDAIATYNTIAAQIDTDVLPAWESIIDKAKTLERVLGYPSSYVSLMLMHGVNLI